MKRIRIILLLLVVVLVCSCLPGKAQAVSGSEKCYVYTPQMTDNTFRYLQEMYIEKYPQMGLRWTQGTEEDKQVLLRLADMITQGCTTDEQKAEAIAGWILRNIEYGEDYRPFYAADVFYARKANCSGYAQLMQTLLRLSGIPAVWGDGFAMDTQVITVEQMQSLWAGHAWCFAYVDGQWKMYDPLWEGTRGLTDRDYIAKNYFLDTVDQITPVYDSGNLPPFRDPTQAYVYADGRFLYYLDGKLLSEPGHGGGSVTINLVGHFGFTVCTYEEGDPAGEEGFRYLDNPERYLDMVRGELFRDGWVQYGTLSLDYHYENGVAAYGIVMERDGNRYYMHFSGANRLFVEEGQYYISDGYFHMAPGYTGKIFEPYWYPQYKDDPEYQITWSSDNPEVATVDQNGVITSTGKTGTTEIWLELKWKGGAGTQARQSFSITFQNDNRVADYNDYQPHECSYQTQVVRPTCTSGGYTVHTCSCGNSYQDNETEALGHRFGPWQTRSEATPDQDGVQVRTCTGCRLEESRSVSYVSPEHVCEYRVVSVIEPDCERDGYTVYACSCGREKTGDEKPALGSHVFDPWIIDRLPTATEEGVRVRFCSVCGQGEVDFIPPGTDVSTRPTLPAEPIPTNPSQGGDHTCQWQVVEVVEPWCEEDGFTVYVCAVCGNEKLDDYKAGGHTFGPWETQQEPEGEIPGYRIRVCENCGYAEEQMYSQSGEIIPPPQDPTLGPTQDPTQGPIQGTTTQPPEKEWELVQDPDGSGITIRFPGADPEQLEGVRVAVELLTGDAEAQVREYLQMQDKELEQTKLFDISLEASGVKIQPDGRVTVSIPIPQGWNAGNLAVYYIAEDGGITDMQARISADGRNVEFDTDHFSCYALAQRSSQAAQPNSQSSAELLIWILVGAGALAVLAVGSLLLWKKPWKKK